MLKKELEEAYNQLKEENKELRRQNKELLQKLSFYQSMDKSDSIKEITDRDKRYQYPSAYDTLNKEQKMYFKKMVNGDNIFLSGNAGTGKSYLTGVFDEFCELNHKNLVKVAPTGVAAKNIDGCTMHRTFGMGTEIQFNDPERVSKVLFSTDIVLVDEISMSRIDNFDYCMKQIEIVNDTRKHRNEEKGYKEGDKEYKNPIQVIFVGDFFQLPPVLKKEDKEMMERIRYHHDIGSGFAFSSEYWDKFNVDLCYLTEVVRQKGDNDFLESLNKVKYGDASGLNYIRMNSAKAPFEKAVTLAGKNSTVKDINNRELAKLQGDRYTSYAEVTGDVKRSEITMEEEFHFKIGARVLMTANDSAELGNRFENGTLGTIIDLKEWRGDVYSVTVQFDDGSIAEVGKKTIENTVYSIEKQKIEMQKLDENGQIQFETVEKEVPIQKVIGTVTQFPMKLGYAISIHKSQGQTYDKMNLIPEIFADGQLYVALSRVTSVKGLHIDGQLKDYMVKTNPEVLAFYEKEQSKQLELEEQFEKEDEVLEKDA